MATKRASSPVEVDGWDDLVTRFPKQWVAYEVLEDRPGGWFGKGRIIAHGPNSARDRVVAKLIEFIEKQPERLVGVLFTGPVEPNEDRIFAIS